MGILDIHFHDPQFEWTINPGTDSERSFSLGSGSESSGSESSGRRSLRRTTGESGSRPSATSKLRSIAVLALVVGGVVALNRARSRRARATAEEESSGRRFSLMRSK